MQHGSLPACQSVRKLLRWSAFGPSRHAVRDCDPRLLSLDPDVRYHVKGIAPIQSACAQAHKPWSRAVGAVEAGVAHPAYPLTRHPAARPSHLTERDGAGHGEKSLGQEGHLVEGTSGPGLAITAMAGIGRWQPVESKDIAHGTAATSSLYSRLHVPAPCASDCDRNTIAGGRVQARRRSGTGLEPSRSRQRFGMQPCPKLGAYSPFCLKMSANR